MPVSTPAERRPWARPRGPRRRAPPRPVDPAHRLHPGESIALLVDVETTGLDHRCAVDDCHALLEVLALEVAGASSFSHLLRSSCRTRVRVWAERTPFDIEDVLKARGYRWSGGGGRPKAWWTEVDENDLREMRFLEREVYMCEVDLLSNVLSAYERYRPG